MEFDQLVEKYNVPAPRYTSYPPAPFWEKEEFAEAEWLATVKKAFDESNDRKGVSLYVHLPYCESLCTYCGCNKRITKNHSVEDSYIDAVLKEWRIYLNAFGDKPRIREIHLGGGTPTFFSAENLARLIDGILSEADRAAEFEFGFEGHPNSVTRDHLTALSSRGFRRISLGVQDFSEKVQRAINRLQPFENVERTTVMAREEGYDSVNFDLIYGLPFQTPDIINHTIDRVGQLMPDRIAFYSYAHVPWKAPSQRGYYEADLPDNAAKRQLYELGKTRFAEMGYRDVGMDHFALPGDRLFKAKTAKTLHRNFMGYTPYATDLLIGLGCSAISDSKYAYAQNLKVVEHYKDAVAQGKLAVFKGHEMTPDDLEAKRLILDLSCHGEGKITENIARQLPGEAWTTMREMEREGLLVIDGTDIEVTPLGFAFVRNICMLFDLRLQKRAAGENMFSRSI